MTFKNYYVLLELPPTASVEDIKRAFRQQIALYHPDKVHHLGKEFQEMAAERAAALTEAYRILSDASRRAEYDRALQENGGFAAPFAAPPNQPAPAADAPAFSPEAPYQEGSPRAGTPPRSGGQFHHERAKRDAFVRTATMGRFRQALDAVATDYDQAQAVGFDVACVPRGKLFSRTKGPRLLGRFVPRVDGPAVAEAWSRGGKWSDGQETCIFLMGSSVAPPGELATAIAEQRRKGRFKLTLIPVDARDWDAHMPVDAPGIAKTLLARLRSGA